MDCSSGVFFPPNLAKISPLFVSIRVASESLMARMKERALSALPAWSSPAKLLARTLWAFYRNCIFPSDPSVGFAEPWAEGAVPLALHFSCGLSLPMGCTRRVMLIPILTAQMDRSSSLGRFTDCGTKRGRIWPQRSHQCVIRVSVSVCLCWGRAKS